ncbi:MAG: TAXI family TRAP transporter solute-binding subunit, partial [Methyloligellaceae bacterium]
MIRAFLAGVVLSAVSFLPMNWAAAQTAAEIREQVNRGTVSIITGGAGGEYVTNTYMKLAGDMATVLDKQNTLRILPIMSYGPVQNVRDLLYLKGIDIGMVHSDVFTYLRQKNLYPTAQSKLRFIVNLYDEPFHIVARKEIAQVSQLAGQKVIVGKPGSGGEMSAHTL